MSDRTSIAVATQPDLEDEQAAQHRSRRADAKPKRQPPYAVVLLNDEEHSFLYVIETLMKVFGYRRPHMALVWTGQGRAVPKVVPRRGSVVHREKVERVPSGFDV